VLRDEDPVIRELAEITRNIFKEIAHKMTSSSIKQSFRRLFKFIYTKRLKPLYNWPKDQTRESTEIKDEKSDKEGLTEDNDEDTEKE
jgi:hypothetical protein